MKLVLAFFAFALLASVDPATLKKINAAKSAAEDAFKSGDYAGAVKHYKYLVDSLGVAEDAVILNLANSLYLSKDTANAYAHYQTVATSPEPDISSKAYQQLGIMANSQGRAEEALSYFKQAIKAEPSNDAARYNYEMLKKKLEEKKKQEEEQQQKNKDQQKEDQQNQDQKDKEQQNKDEQKSDQEKKDQQSEQEQKDQEQQQEKEKQEQEQQEQEQKDQEEQQKQESDKEEMPNLDREKLEQMKISEEKAKMILEAMKNQEKQYLQQQKRKPTQSPDRSKPDW